MDTTAIKYFMEIASGQTFWEVSENYHISQSSVSKSIFRLEEELGVKLFSREKRAVKLTPAGILFYESMKKLEPEFQQALLSLAQFSAHKNICLCVAPDPDFMSLNLRIPNSSFFIEHPDIGLTMLKETNPQQAIAHLEQGHADFLISHRFSFTDQSCDSYVVYPDTLYAIFPKDHPMAGRESVGFQELMNETILMRSAILLEVIRETCDSLSLPLPPHLKIFDVPASQLRRDHLINRVAFGQGITFYFKSDLYLFSLRHVALCPVTGCPEFPVVLSKKKGKRLSVYQEAFRKYLCDVIFVDQNW